MQPPEKPRNVNYFIDRQNYSRSFLEMLQDQNVIDIIADTEATYGTGKTTVLSDLYGFVQQDARFASLWMSLNLFSIHHLNPTLAKRIGDEKLRTSPEILTQNFISYFELLSDLSKTLGFGDRFVYQLKTTTFDLLKALGQDVDANKDIDQWHEAFIRVVPHGKIEPGAIPEATYRTQIDKAVNAITEIFLNRYNEEFKVNRNVLFADDFCWISDQHIGDWVFKRLTERMENTVVIVAHTELSLKQNLKNLVEEEQKVRPLRLTDFTPEEVGEYLEKRLPDLVKHDPRLPDAVYFFSKGHAQTICLIADLIEYSDPDSMDLSPQISASAKELIKQLAKKLLDGTRPSWLNEALKISAIVRRFDGELLHYALLQNDDYIARFYSDVATAAETSFGEVEAVDLRELCGEDDLDDVAQRICETIPSVTQGMIEDLLIKLERYSFVNHYITEEAGTYFALHHQVGEQIVELLIEEDEENDTEDFINLHERVAKYYQSVLGNYEEQDSTTYVKLYKYEDPVWQRMISEWLYHLSFYKDRKVAQFELANIFLAAWSWWAWYVPFSFCDRLLKHWEATQGGEEDSIFEMLKRFQDNYPKGYSTTKIGAKGWEETQHALEALLEYFELDIDADPTDYDKDQRWMFSNILEFYTACFRFRRPDPDFARAEKIYKRSIEIAEEDDDKYSISYFQGYLAEMYMEMGEYEKAIERAELSNDLLREISNGEYYPFRKEMDYELASLNYLTLGHSALHFRRWNDVAHYYLITLKCSYAFNFVNGPTVPPDPYTIQWHKDVSYSAFKHLVDSWNANIRHKVPIEVILTYIKRGWTEYRLERDVPVSDIPIQDFLNRGDIHGLGEALLPPDPDTQLTELNNLYVMESYMDDVRLLLDQQEEEV